MGGVADFPCEKQLSLPRQQTRQQQVACPAKVRDLFVNWLKVIRRGADDRFGWANQFDGLHICLRHRCENRAAAHHIVFGEAVAHLLPEKCLMPAFVSNRGEAATDDYFLVGDVHAPDRGADAEKDVARFSNAALDCAEQAVGRKSVAEISHALMEWLSFARLVVEL
jgi:hypothetical protein